MKVSFIIPLYNGLVLTQAMLASLRATVPAHLTHEIIFVDDGSTDGTRDWLANLPPPCRFLLNEKNLGFAGTCNRGAAAAQGELIFLLNNDLVLLPGWLEPMQAALHSSQRPGIVGNIQINAATGVIDHTGIEISSAAKLVHSHWQPRGLSRLMCAQRTVPAVTAACCVLPRETFLREGGFDESFRNGGEDIDLCWRLAQRGYGVVVAFKSVVRHHIRASRGPVSLADEANTQRLFARWRKEIIALGDRCWAKNTIRQFFINPCSVNGFTLLSALAYRAGWRTRPPRAMALAFDSALHYEELHWQQRLAGTIKPVVYPPSAYALRGVYHDWSKASNADSVWLLDQAQLTLPAGTPARNFFINGFLLPPSSDEPPAAGQLGLRLTINGAQSLDFFPLPTGHFNCGLDRPLVTRDEETKIEITLLGIKRANAFARLAQRISQWPLPLKWRAWAAAYQSHPLNRRLRLAQIVGDKQPIYDFAYANTHEIRRRRRVPPATHYLDNRLDRLRFLGVSQKFNSRPTGLVERLRPAAPVSKNLQGPLYYEELQWSAASADAATKNYPLSAYTLHGVYRDWTSGVNGDTVWLRDRAKLSLPPGTPAHNFFVNGFLLPELADQPSSSGPLGLRLTVNDARSIDFYPLPIGHFNCGIDQLIIGTEVATEIEITLLGAERSNTLAWLGRLTAQWPLPQRWREWGAPQQSHHLNQRLRLAQMVDDRQVIYNFKHARPQKLSRRWQLPRTRFSWLKTAAFTEFAVQLGWRLRPAATSTLMVDRSIYNEPIPWLQQREAGVSAPSNLLTTYTLHGVYRDWTSGGNADTVWLRDRAQLTIAAGTPVDNFFVNGFVLPPPSDQPEATGSLGLRLTINGCQNIEFFPLPVGHFNCGIINPLVVTHQPTVVEITLLGVERSNTLAWLGRLTAQWPLPQRWREWAAPQQSYHLNQRLRLAQMVDDRQVIYNFKHARPQKLSRRWQLPRTRFSWLKTAALTEFAVQLGWRLRPAATSTLMVDRSIYNEPIPWLQQWEAGVSAPSNLLTDYSVDGLFRDRRGLEVNADTLWLRDRARVILPAGTPIRNFFVNGFVLPPPSDQPETTGSLGLRLTINGSQCIEFFPLPIDHFNCGIIDPLVVTHQPTVVEITLLGVERSNTLAWLGRLTAKWPLPRRWRQRLEAYRLQRLNQRLRLSQIVGDDEPIYDFKHATPLTLARRWRTPPTGVNLIGWFRATLGVGESARCMARACDAADLPAALIDLRLNCLNPPSVDTFATRLQTANPHSVNIFHVDPPASEEIDHHHGANFRKDKYNIAYWAWELPEFPDHWVKQAAHFHEIWCPSAFVRDAIAAKISRPVHVMPHAIAFPTPAANGRQRFKLPTDRFLFLFAYDLNSYQERKNPLAVVAAYRRAFPDERGVGLVIKTQNPERNTEAYARLQAALTGLQHAQIITEALPSADVHLLQAACDAFVSLHRAEGFGLSVAECMYLGKPVISTDWSATAEFVNVHNGCPVKCTLVKLTETHGPYQQGQIWAEPNVEHAAEWMQRLINEPSLGQTLGQQAAADIRERFAPAVIGARYRRRLEAFALWAREA